MRRRGKVFGGFKAVEVREKSGDVVKALSIFNENLKLVLELLADIRANTSTGKSGGSTTVRPRTTTVRTQRGK